jgi:hypothetical protein
MRLKDGNLEYDAYNKHGQLKEKKKEVSRKGEWKE